MAVFHDEVEIEDMEFDEDTEMYYYPCPCGDKFQISKVIKIYLHLNWAIYKSHTKKSEKHTKLNSTQKFLIPPSSSLKAYIGLEGLCR